MYVFVCNNYAFREFSLYPNPFLEYQCYINYLYVVEMKISGSISNSLDLNKYYPSHKQHSRSFSHRLSTLGNVNADDTVRFSIITQKVLYEEIFYYNVLESSLGMLLEYSMKNEALHLKKLI